ncbi:DMT family transporter [Pontivivens insulae]|uniref:Riboflavin transporter n=1 Tax=Pontivivens insulae TaxID=1639689 RepID=A0A2R8ACN3_9RHOB|nr:DMT family transporter [Pontivivens insulae]RED13939.1 threonine/homoserine efflux transporter RhtA [Pontivivens insulae]SPF30013.1 Riboflavin transporter [Pontivivens insulae]
MPTAPLSEPANGHKNGTTGHRKGILLILASIFFFTIMDATANSLTARHDPIMVVWARYISQVLWTVMLLAPRLPAILPTPHWKLQMLRSMLVFGATISFYFALSGLDLAEATAIFEVNPLIVTLLAIFVLGESVGPRRWFALAAGLIGALIIIRPGLDVFTPYALLPVLAAFFYASYAIATRFLSADENPLTSFVYTGLFGTLVASVLVIPVFEVPGGGDIVLMLGIGLAGGAGQYLLILALRAAPASVLAPMTYFGLALNALWGLLFFAEWPDFWTWIGAIIIVGAGLYVWHRERVTHD